MEIRTAGLAALFLLIAASAAAQDDEEDVEGREVHETPLPGLVPGLVLRVVTVFEMGDYYETDIELRWRDAAGERRQALVECTMGTAPAAGYRARVVRRGVEIEYLSGNRYADEGETTRERWELEGDAFVQRWSRTTSPNQRGLHRMHAALDRGDFAAARRIARSLDATPNGGWTDQSTQVFGDFLRAVHRVAMAEARRDPGAAARRFAALFDDPPMESSEVGANARGWCLEEGLASCPRDPALIVGALLRIVNDVGYVYEQAGMHERAVEILLQVVEIDPNRPAARINLGDALWSLGRREEARAHYREYVRLRSLEPRAPVPARITERLAAE